MVAVFFGVDSDFFCFLVRGLGGGGGGGCVGG